MRFKKLDAGVELPEKYSPTLYINVRSAERVDVRPHEVRRVKTGVSVLVGKDETARIVGPNVSTDEIKTGNKYSELIVTMHNLGDRNVMVYPGMVVARIEVTKTKAEATNKRRTTTIVSEATFKPVPSEELTNVPTTPGLHKKPCKGC